MLKDLIDLIKGIIFMILITSMGLLVTYITIHMTNNIVESYGDKNQLYGPRYLAMFIW